MPKNLDLALPKKRTFIGNASIWKRLAAFILDLLIIDFFLFASYEGVLRKIIKGSGGVVDTYRFIQSEGGLSSVLIMVFFLMTTVLLLYFILQEFLFGQTVGKMLLGLRIVSISDPSEFQNIGFFQAFLRCMFLIPTIPFVFLWVIDPVYLLFAKNGQRLSEWLSRTRVIEVYSF